jgi:hypothetical protein
VEPPLSKDNCPEERTCSILFASSREISGCFLYLIPKSLESSIAVTFHLIIYLSSGERAMGTITCTVYHKSEYTPHIFVNI